MAFQVGDLFDGIYVAALFSDSTRKQDIYIQVSDSTRKQAIYIADAYFGLMKVGPEGGLATSLSTEAEGLPFKFTNDLDLAWKLNIPD
ncbi:Protein STRICTOSIDINE SYNTHASE-LIKE 3, partial [Cucurbita argyrosperma subsp. sororia]